MSNYFFSEGNGRLTKREISRRTRIARQHGARFIAVHPDGCRCGYGCRPCTCPILHYWFEKTNEGMPFDLNVQRQVEAEL